MTSDPGSYDDQGLVDAAVSEDDVRKESRSREWSDAARFIHWVGISLLGTFLVGLINALPPRFADPNWQLNLITLLITGGLWSLLGALLICLARVFNHGDLQVQNRALLVRTLASWVALGWLLLIPLQLFLGVRLINSQIGQELVEIQKIERVSRSVRSATTEDELRTAMAQIPNQPPLPRLTVPLEVAKANLLAQFQKNINTAKNNQNSLTSNRWLNWMKEVFRNSLQCGLLSLGFLAIGKNRVLNANANATRQAPPSRSRRSRSRA